MCNLLISLLKLENRNYVGFSEYPLDILRKSSLNDLEVLIMKRNYYRQKNLYNANTHTETANAFWCAQFTVTLIKTILSKANLAHAMTFFSTVQRTGLKFFCF